MRITLIRHGKVDMDWKKKYTSEEYDEAWAEYDRRDILPVTKHLELPENTHVFVTDYKRTWQTAEQFLGCDDYEIINSLANEIPLRSFRDTNRRVSRHVMDVIGRMQWYFPTKRQEEFRRQSYKRAIELVRYLENQVDDAAVVMHGFYIRTVCRALRRLGYKLDHRALFNVPNLMVINAVKKEKRRKRKAS